MKKFFLVISMVLLVGCATVSEKDHVDKISEINKEKDHVDKISEINKDMARDPAGGGDVRNYYVCDDGNDANDGLTVDAPWKSFEKAISKFNTMNAGDAILFCRGGVFPALTSPRIFNLNCSVDRPCFVSDYQKPNSSATDAPKIVSQHNGAVFNFQDGGNADHDEGYVIENLMLQGQGNSIGTAVFFYNDIDDVYLRNLYIQSFKTGVRDGGANTANAGSDQLNERLITDNVKVFDARYPVVGDSGLIAGVELIQDKLTADQQVQEKESVDTTVYTGEPGSGSYYVCDNGDDNNSGQTPYHPWRTYDKAMQQFGQLLPGESINFCRGGQFSFSRSPRLSNQQCTADAPCTIGDYVAPDTYAFEKPVIVSLDGETAFNFQDSGDADPDGGYVLKNLILKSNVHNKAAIFIYNDVDDLTISNLEIDGFRIGVHSSGAGTLSEGVNGVNERILLEKSKIINNSSQGWLGSCSDCKIDSNFFKNNGFEKASLDHNLYFGAKNATNVVISNNILTESTMIDGACRGVSLVVHGIAQNLRIENNYVYENIGAATHGCWGISVDPGYSSVDESFSDIVIRGNTVVNTGNVGIGCASCENVLIEDNTIVSNQEYGFIGIKVPVRPEDSVKSRDVVVRNNEITLASRSSIYKKGIVLRLDKPAPLEANKVFSGYDNVDCAIVNDVILDNKTECQVY